MQGEPPDWYDFLGIVLLLLVNSTISFIEENNAGNAAAALMARLAPKAKALRDGTWMEIDACELVPGDMISVKLGDIIPADARLMEGDALKIDQVRVIVSRWFSSLFEIVRQRFLTCNVFCFSVIAHRGVPPCHQRTRRQRVLWLDL